MNKELIFENLKVFNSNLLTTLSSNKAVLGLTNKLIKFFSLYEISIYYLLPTSMHLRGLSKFIKSSAFFIGMNGNAAYTSYVDIALPVIDENNLSTIILSRLLIFLKYKAITKYHRDFSLLD